LPLTTLSTKNPDLRLVGCDGSGAPIHSILLIVNSSFLKSIFNSLDESTDVVVIVPDFSSSELESLCSVINGKEEAGFVSGQILDTLGMQQYKIWVCAEVFEDLEDGIDLDDNDDPIDSNSNEVTPSNQASFVPHEILPNNQIQDASREMVSGNTFVNQVAETESDIVIDIIVPVINPNIEVFQADIENVVINEVEVSEMNRPERVKCTICDQMMKNIKTLKQHIKLKHVENPAEVMERPLNKKCFICNQYLTPNQFRQHMKELHPGQVNKEKCDLCDQRFTSIYNLKRHKESVHNENKRYECDRCECITQRSDLMKEHMLTHTEKKFHCKKCNMFKTNRERDLVAHSLKCKPKPYECDLCGGRSISLEALRQHKHRNHS
jgi:hypothetical protein